MSNYKELKVWQKSHLLALRVYKITETFPANEMYGLTSQLRRVAASIPTNIAEGQGRLSKKEYKQFLSISRGSAKEVEYLLLLAKDLGYINDEIYKELSTKCETILKMLNGLIKSIKV